MTAAITWFDQTEDSQPVACMIEPENHASVLVAEKLDFVRNGRHQTKDGSELDMFVRG